MVSEERLTLPQIQNPAFVYGHRIDSFAMRQAAWQIFFNSAVRALKKHHEFSVLLYPADKCLYRHYKDEGRLFCVTMTGRPEYHKPDKLMNFCPEFFGFTR